MSEAPTDVTSGAGAAARAAADRAGVEIVELHTAEAAQEAANLLADIWQTDREAAPVSAHLLQAMAHTGSYVVGVYTEGRMVGASLGWRSGDDAAELHSHISGVSERVQNRGVGLALKLHQRAWALGRGFTTITWTVDPLVRRNMVFNLGKLGAEVTAYLPNFYGAMNDGVNGVDDSDRLLLAWRLMSDRAAAALEGRTGPAAAAGGVSSTDGLPVAERLLRVGEDSAPVVTTGGPSGGPVRRTTGWPVGRTDGGGLSGSAGEERLRYQIPPDIVELRAADGTVAAAWRRALRETLGTAIQAGWQVAEFTREGDYIVVPGARVRR